MNHIKDNEQYQYVWFVLHKALRQNTSCASITYEISNFLVPYMEINTEAINDSLEDQNVPIPVNPFIRFQDVFDGFYLMNTPTYPELQKNIIDIFFHFLANLDLQKGLTKKSIFYQEIIRLIEIDEIYGKSIAQLFHVLTSEEKIIIASGIYDKNTYEFEVETYKKILKMIFFDIIIYNHKFDAYALVIFINQKKTTSLKRKYRIIEKLFLPIGFNTKIFWEHHFGVIGNDETMIIGKMAIY